MFNGEHILLTQEQVDALEPGTKVVIIWSGGNGPHEYTIRKHYETSWAVECHSPIRFVGEYPLTQVWLAPPNGGGDE